ncbi:MAG: alpha/beta fold hydrolase [Gemmatimonadetes bacterium]|nr:alpha/beta fold hydrolase [Gemmatimonadota bacterium]
MLVPGWHDRASKLKRLRRRLIASGWPERRVAAVDFADPCGSNVEHAAELAQVVSGLMRAESVVRIDVVAHSMGGLAARHYLAFLDGAEHVRRVVFLATPHRGTRAAYGAWGRGGREMEPNSEFLRNLNARAAVPAGIRAVTIRTRLELRVFPNRSGTLPGVTDVLVCCPTHDWMVRSGRVFRHILESLTSP